MKEQILKQLKGISPGSLVSVSWCDASIGKSMDVGLEVDVPVETWGVFIGLLGQKNKHIVIIHSAYRYSDGDLDLEYTAVPIDWTTTITLITKDLVGRKMARKFYHSFLKGGRMHGRTSVGRRVRNHAKLV